MDYAALTFERAFAGLARFRRRDGGAGAWPLRIARNIAIDAHRRSRLTIDLAGAAGHLAATPIFSAVLRVSFSVRAQR